MYKIVYKSSNVYSKRLTEQQREFADCILIKLAESKDPRTFSDQNGCVKPMMGDRKGEYAFKPSKNLRAMRDLEIRILFKPSDPLNRILVIRVAPRDEVYR